MHNILSIFAVSIVIVLIAPFALSFFEISSLIVRIFIIVIRIKLSLWLIDDDQ